MKTISTIFSGGEGVGVGAKMAGLTHLWGIEYDDKIAQVARDNGFNTITADVLDIDPHSLKVPDILHASPVCTRASVANANASEAQLDIDTAKKTAEFIDVLKPQGFTLENVYPYREFESFQIICDPLIRNGYSFDYWHLNAANYGVPQTRKRLILIARLDGGHNRIPKPTPTHHNPKDFDDNQMALFAPTTKPWVGWYEAIEDLIPTLPDSEFAPWQLERLPDELVETLSINPNRNSFNEGWISNNDTSNSNGPIWAITANKGLSNHRAFILDGKLNDNSTRLTNRDGENPIFTVTTSHNNRDVKAYITSGGNTYTPTLPDSEPVFTIGSSPSTHGNNKALLVSNQTQDRERIKAIKTFDECQPVETLRTPGGGRDIKAWLQQGHVVKMTPRALARFQSFPDWYKLPDSNALAVKVIGNAVPPLLYSEIVKVLL